MWFRKMLHENQYLSKSMLNVIKIFKGNYKINGEWIND